MTTATTSARVEPLVAQLGYIQQALGANIAGLTHEESLAQPSPGGNCLNWVLGHIVATRNQTLALLGKPPVWDEGTASRYVRGTAPIESSDEGVVPLEEILTAFDASQGALLDGFREISEEELAVEVPWFGKPTPKAIALAGLVFHEAYHLGQTGLLRRLTGKEGAIR